MRNFLIIAMMVVSVGYMFVIMANKYEDIKQTNSKIEHQKNK